MKFGYIIAKKNHEKETPSYDGGCGSVISADEGIFFTPKNYIYRQYTDDALVYKSLPDPHEISQAGAKNNVPLNQPETFMLQSFRANPISVNWLPRDIMGSLWSAWDQENLRYADLIEERNWIQGRGRGRLDLLIGRTTDEGELDASHYHRRNASLYY